MTKNKRPQKLPPSPPFTISAEELSLFREQVRAHFPSMTWDVSQYTERCLVTSPDGLELTISIGQNKHLVLRVREVPGYYLGQTITNGMAPPDNADMNVLGSFVLQAATMDELVSRYVQRVKAIQAGLTTHLRVLGDRFPSAT